MRRRSFGAFADLLSRYGRRFLRIESIAEGPDGSLRSLDLQDGKCEEGREGLRGGKISPLYIYRTAFPNK